MNSLVDSDIQRFVACLVLGYLENQQLQKTYSSFCETSRHLTKEKNGLRYGNKPLDTSVGLVNIIREYFLLKSRINEFLRLCPHYPVIIKLIDSEDTLVRMDIILKALKECLEKTEKAPIDISKKRKLDKSRDEDFNVSQTNTSTPDSINPPKRTRKSLTTPFLTLSANKEFSSRTVDKASTSRAELSYESSSNTSGKDSDDIEEEEGDHSPMQRSTASPTNQVLKDKKFFDKVINDIGVADKVADLINKTLSSQDLEPKQSLSNESQCNSNNQNILSVTQNEGFDEVIAEIIDKYLSDYPEENVGHTSTSSDKLSTESETAAADDIPIKQRLRPRVERTQLSSEKRRVNIISNELLPRIVPEATSLPIATTEADLSQQAQVVFIQSGNEMIPVIQSVPSFNASTASVMATTIDSSLTASTVVYQHVLESQPLATTDVEMELPNNEVEKKESTPKITLYPSFLESKSKSTPRRKAQHVRILDFNQTPSTRRLSTIREFSTPANGIPAKTPGSAPATVDVTKSTKKLEDKQLTPALEDDNSNSNSISHTPKVSKKCRRRKIAVQKSEEKMKPGEEDLKKPAAHELTIKTVDDWNNMRSRSKAVPIDQLLRLQNQEVESNAPKKPSRRRRKPVVKTPAKKPRAKKVKEKEKSPSTEIDENKPLSAMKFRISSPRKLMLNKKSSAKKKTVNGATEKCDAQEEVKTAGTTEISNEMNQSAATDAPSELNRSDTVQEVAMVLTNFPETILARHKSTEECETNTQSQADSGICQSLQLETPFKDLISGLNETPFKNLMTPLPNTPRFAIPLSSISQETPMPKIFASSSTVVTLQSLVKNCDIQTPSFPITPGFKLTPLKDLLEVSPASGYMSRRTDYSSSSSYYKPDESEDINQKINEIISQRRDERLSQSESESGYTSVKVVVKKVECPGAIERFTPSKENTEHPVPHYTMMDEGMLSENFVTTATSDSSSSDSSSSDSSCITSCNSSCSSSCPKRPKDKSHNENTMDKLERIANSEEKDSDWQCEDPKMKKDDLISPALVNKTTGEVRFPLRNFITPRKVEIDPERQKLIETNKIKEMLQSKNPPRGLSVEEERAKIIREQEAVKKRTLAKIRKESAASYNQHKYKKSQVKNFKLPAQTVAKPAYVSRKDQILQQQFTERPRPTPLRLIPSTSSSRRKNATPRKTISMNELPREEYSPKKKRTKSETDTKQSVSFDSQDDNAILPEDSTSLETSNEIELMSPFAAKETTTIASRFDEGSNTFQRTLMDKGFDKNEAKYLQSELIDKLENSVETPALAVEESIELLHQSLLDEKEENNQKEVSLESNEEKAESANEITDGGNREEQDDSSSDEDESEDECLAEENEGRVFIVNEPENFKAVVSMSSVFEILSVKCNLGDREVNLKDTNNIDIFSMNPETTKASKVKKSSPKKLTDDKTNGKASPKKNGKSKSRNSVRWDQSTSGNLKTSPSKTKASTEQPQTVGDIGAILAKIHGN